MGVRAGKLRFSVVIQTPTETQGSTGEVTLSWTTHTTRWAGFEPLSGREYFGADGRRSEATARFWLRNDVSGLTTKMRVSHGGGAYDIEAVIPPERPGDYLQLMVKDAA